jgi:autotransporter-associated beta strand protein
MVFNTNVRTASPVTTTQTRSLTLTGGGTFDFKASMTHDGLFAGVGGQLIVSNSGGTVNLRASNTLGGGVKVSGGTVNLYAAGSTGTGPLELASASSIVNVWDNNAISSSSSLVGASTYPTLDFKVAGDVTLNLYGVSPSSAGGSMNFTNSSGSPKTVTFTNADNYITQTLAGARGLSIKSADLTLDFAGNIQNNSTQTNTTTFDGAGNFIVRGSLLDTTNATGIRTIAKTGAGKLTLQGAGNNYSGSTLVGGGTLEVGASGALPVASSITVSNGATLKFNKSSGTNNVGPLAVAGTLEQNLVTVTSSGAVDLTGSTLKVNGTPTLASYTLVSGTSLTGTPTLNPSISDYALRISGNSILLEKVVTEGADAVWLDYQDGLALTGDAIMTDIKVEETTLYTYYAGLVWNTGYMGLQRGGGGYFKHVHFSVWDPPGGGFAELVWADKDVVAERFGGEGTGCKAMWPLNWNENITYRLCVLLTHINASTYYDSYFFDPTIGTWKHMATFRRTDALHSFSYVASFVEDFGSTLQNRRSCLLGNAWLRKFDKEWVELRRARYASGGTKTNKDADVEGNFFRLETGGSTTSDTPNYTMLTRSSTTIAPDNTGITIQSGDADSSVILQWQTLPWCNYQLAWTTNLYEWPSNQKYVISSNQLKEATGQNYQRFFRIISSE